MTHAARVESVYAYSYGARVLNDTAAGATVIPMIFPVDFDETGGNLTRVPIDDASTDTTVYAYTAIDLDVGSITLAAPTSVLFAADDMLYVDPPTSELRALVRLADSEDEPAIDCRVTHALQLMLPEGIRNPGTGESVVISLVGDEWTVTDMVGKTYTDTQTLDNLEVTTSLKVDSGATFTGPDSWHQLGALGQSGISITTSRYRLTLENELQIEIIGTVTSSPPGTSGNKAFPNVTYPRTTTGTVYLPVVYGPTNMARVSVGTDGTVTLYWPSGLASGNGFSLETRIPLD